MAFLVRAEPLEQPERLEFAVLTAALAAQRALGASVKVRVAVKEKQARQTEEDSLVEVILAGPAWRQAASAQQNCFSRAEAGRRSNDA